VGRLAATCETQDATIDTPLIDCAAWMVDGGWRMKREWKKYNERTQRSGKNPPRVEEGEGCEGKGRRETSGTVRRYVVYSSSPFFLRAAGRPVSNCARTGSARFAGTPARTAPVPDTGTATAATGRPEG